MQWWVFVYSAAAVESSGEQASVFSTLLSVEYGFLAS